MNCNHEEYIQLPPLPRDTEGLAVQMIWEFLKLSKEEQKTVHAELKVVVNKDNIEKYEEPKEFRRVKKEEFADFEETISNMIRALVLEASDIACWVFAKKYVEGWTLEQMIGDMPQAVKFIVAMDTLFEKNMENVSTNKYGN